MINREYKDRLFSFIFGKAENRVWTLSLYNAVNESNYTDPNDIEITTMGNTIYMGMKNDLSFILYDYMNLYAHQSTYNPNMPLRELIYTGHIYAKYVNSRKLNIYGNRQLIIPIPKIIVFYNGKQDSPDEVILELKDAFPADIDVEESDIQLRVRMLNINYDHNKRIMSLCKPLTEYSWFIENVRKNKDNDMEIEDAVNKALSDMPDDFQIKDYIISNKAEVVTMCITEYNEVETMEAFKEEGREEGREELIEELLKDGTITPEKAALLLHKSTEECHDGK